MLWTAARGSSSAGMRDLLASGAVPRGREPTLAKSPADDLVGRTRWDATPSTVMFVRLAGQSYASLGSARPPKATALSTKLATRASMSASVTRRVARAHWSPKSRVSSGLERFHSGGTGLAGQRPLAQDGRHKSVKLGEQRLQAVRKNAAHAETVGPPAPLASWRFLGRNAADRSRASPARLRWCMYFIVVRMSAWPIHACTWTMVAWLMAIDPKVWRGHGGAERVAQPWPVPSCSADAERSRRGTRRARRGTRGRRGREGRDRGAP